MQPEVIVAGFLVGLVVGVSGMGAGPLLTPVLILFLGVRPVVAIGTGVVAMGLTKMLGGYRHLRQGTVNTQSLRYLCMGGIPGAVLGSSLTALLFRSYEAQADEILTRTLAGALILVAVLIYQQVLFGKSRDVSRSTGNWMGPRRVPFTIGVGFLGGLLMGVTSTGTGTLVVVLMVMLYPLRAATVVGTDVVYGAVVTLQAGLLHALFGHVELGLLAGILMGSLPGIYLGSILCSRLPERILRPVLATLILATGLKMV